MHKGYHVYININNLEAILKKEEDKTDEVKKAFHQLDTYVASIENYIKNRGDKGVVEKLTSSRLHLYFIADENDLKIQREVFKTVSYAYYISKFISQKIGKYNNVLNYEIGIGVDYGDFTIFSFIEAKTKIKEITSIGSPANRAAKIQSLVKGKNSNKIAITNNVYDLLESDLQKLFNGNEIAYQKATLRYADLTVYDCELSKLEAFYNSESYDTYERFACERANNLNIAEIDFLNTRKKLDYSELSLRNNRCVNGIMLFADIRGFTKKFQVDGSNLAEMNKATEIILQTLYDCVSNQNGIHVQFQGDRISAFFHTFQGEDSDYIVRAFRCALSIIDKVCELNQNKVIISALRDQKLRIGIGCSCGDIFATRLGMKNQKDNFAAGQTVREADEAEDDVAGVRNGGSTSEIAVTEDCYKLLNASSTRIAKIIKTYFTKFGQYYVTSIGLEKIENTLEKERQAHNYEEAKNASVFPWKRNNNIKFENIR